MRLTGGAKRRLHILRGVSGVLRPGRLALLLGPPASGKSTLLKALAGKLTAGNLQARIPSCAWAALTASLALDGQRWWWWCCVRRSTFQRSEQRCM